MTKKRNRKRAQAKAARKARATAGSHSKSRKASKTAASSKQKKRQREGTGEPKPSSETVRVVQYRPVYENGWRDDLQLRHAECLYNVHDGLDKVASEDGVKTISAFDVHGRVRTREDYHRLNSPSRIDELTELLEKAEVEWHDPNEAIARDKARALGTVGSFDQ